MTQTLGPWFREIVGTATHELGVVLRWATSSPTAFAVTAALVVALLVVIALARK